MHPAVVWDIVLKRAATTTHGSSAQHLRIRHGRHEGYKIRNLVQMNNAYRRLQIATITILTSCANSRMRPPTPRQHSTPPAASCPRHHGIFHVAQAAACFSKQQQTDTCSKRSSSNSSRPVCSKSRRTSHSIHHTSTLSSTEATHTQPCLCLSPKAVHKHRHLPQFANPQRKASTFFLLSPYLRNAYLLCATHFSTMCARCCFSFCSQASRNGRLTL